MRKFFLMLGLISVFISLPIYAKSAVEHLDQVVAIINDDVVTQSELTRALEAFKAQLAQANMPSPNEAALNKQMLNQLINKKLQLQIAKQMGMKVTSKEVTKAIGMIAKQNNVSVNTLYEQLKREGLSIETYKKEIHEQLLLQKLQRQEVVSHINVSKEEAANFAHSKAWQDKRPKEYQVRDILIPLPDAPSPQQLTVAKKQAEDLLAAHQQGKSFKELAALQAKSKFAPVINQLDWRKQTELPTIFANAASQLAVKQVAGPIKAPNGFHLVQLTGIRYVGTQPKLNAEQIQEVLFQRKFQEALQTWLSKLRSQAFIVTNPTK